MWDSSEEKLVARPDTFKSLDHFKELCIGTKIILSPNSDIYYPEGWKGLIEDFVESTSTINCTIRKINQDYGYLDISFITKQLSNEAKIWRALSECRKSTYIVCHLCGSTVHSRTVRGCLQLCRSCQKTARSEGFTGTWLDRYAS